MPLYIALVNYTDRGMAAVRESPRRLDAAKAQGKRTSRPPIPEATKRKIAELRGQGVSVRQIAKELGIAYGTAWNYVNKVEGDAPGP